MTIDDRPRYIQAAATAALAAGLLGLVWSFRYFPSQDGPSHLYNTWILLHWNDPDAIFRRFYTLDLTPVPNWLGTAVLALLMLVFEPLTADRMFVTLAILAMTGGWWYWLTAAGARRSPLLALGPLLASNFLLYKGFYSFCLSLPLFLLATGYAVKHAARLDLKRVGVLYLILVPAYFAHIVSFAMALLFALTVAILRAPRDARRILGLPAPALWLSPLLVLILSATIGLGSGPMVRWGLPMLARYFLRGEWLVSFNRAQILVSSGLMALIGLLLIAAVARAARARVVPDGAPILVAAAAGALLLYLAMPRGVSGGWYLSERLAMFPVLLLAPLAGRDLRARTAVVSMAAVAALTIGQVAILAGVHREYDALLSSYTAPAGRVARNAVMLPLRWREAEPDLRVFPLLHAAGYYGILRGAVNLGDYEGKTNHFQVRFREEIVMPPHDLIERDPSAIDVRRYAPSIDTIITWNMRRAAPDGLIASYEQAYDPVVDEGRLIIFERKAP